MTFPLRTSSRLVATLASVLSFLAIGCGIGVTSSSPSGELPAFSGIVHGGSQPIIGATVTLSVTASNGYGGAATTLATTTTGNYGQFSFPANSYVYGNVDGTQNVYMTVAGGNAGTFGANSNILLMAALGPATSLTSQASAQNVQVYISEASTVAAAYALSNFITDASGIVSVSAPANNNAISAACSSGYSMTCTASGLQHAFQNAANLVNAAGTNSAPGNGLANSVSPVNSAASVPQALINYLANVLTACTNSTGGVATNTATPCGKLFAATTPPGGTAPTDTLQAAINMAKYPTNNVNLTGVNTCTTTPAIIACIPAPQAAFVPTLSSAPTDLSVAIVYTNTQPSSGTSAPYFLSLDAQDNVFVAVKDSVPQSGVAGFASNGKVLFSYTANSSTIYVTPFATATDNLGHVWLTDTLSQSNAAYPYGTIRGFYTGTVAGTTGGAVYTTFSGVANAIGSGNVAASNSNGTPGATAPATPALVTAESRFSGIGIDRNNSIWVCKNGGNGTFRFDFAAGTSGSSPDTYTDAASGGYAKNFSTGCTDVKFDNFQTLVEAGYSSTTPGGNVGFFPNINGTTATPAYLSATNVKSSGVSTSVGSTAGTGPAGTTTGTSCTGTPAVCGVTGGLALVASTSSTSGTTTTTTVKAYVPGSSGAFLATAAPAYNTSTSTLTDTASIGSIPQVNSTVAVESYPEFDGNGVLWIPSNTAAGNISYGTPNATTAPTAITLAPCYLPSAATTCAANNAASYANVLQIDSTGSVWVISQNNGGVLTQIIGTATPAWPAYYYATYGVKPQ